ncbi:MAG: CotH kinase family protein, partial [Muribaculaceae bacterium]|nr:CotH kinase family protein [Muribaculaceae bacterium]
QVFVPDTGDNWAQGSWQSASNPVNPDLPYSGTLPVMYINTEGNAAITSTEVYLNATCYINNLGLEGYASLGSAEAPVTLQIKGRGNYTWTGFEKKPYRLKFTAKQAPLGMNKNKHFNLIAHADDDLGFLRNTVGFQLSRLLKLAYTPEQQPVEVILNGNYIGLYFITDKIRVEKDRVNIVEQADNATDEYAVTGGWLVEIDNYEEAGQVVITEGNGSTLRFTMHTPEELSTEQRNYITSQVTAINQAIYASDKTSTAWESLVDMDALARYYIVQEVMDDAESFHGSCYLHKDIGYDTKWVFGPVWDFGNSFHRGYNQFIYVNPPFGQSWIGEIAKFSRFQSKVVEIWRPFFGTDYPSIDAFIDAFADQISAAAVADYNRWPSYGNRDIAARKAEFKNRIRQKTEYLRQQWGNGINSVELTEGDSADSFADSYSPTADNRIYDITGRLVGILSEGESLSSLSAEGRLSSGIYILRSRKFAISR